MEVIRDFWVMSAAIISRATGSWKKERDEHENHKNEFYQKLASDPKCLTLINLKREIAALTNSKRPDAKKLMEKEKRYQSLLKQNPTLYAGIITLDAHINQVDNYQRKRDGQLASKTHLFILNASALVGAALLATPLAPFGAAILIGTAIYGILHKFDFPAKWASRISNYFYGPKEPDSVGAIISNAKKRGVKLKLEPDAIEQIEPGLKIKNVHDNSVDLFKKLGAEHVEVDAIIEGETEVIGKEQQLAATIAHLPPLNSKTGENEGEREGETEGMHVKCLAN
ncbi:MAG: hypothetical protein ABI597_07655 [Gammaproteobacteria bacterium]